jgi:hypothetical protein
VTADKDFALESRELMSETVENLKAIIGLWDAGRYSPNDFVDKLDWCLFKALNALELIESDVDLTPAEAVVDYGWMVLTASGDKLAGPFQTNQEAWRWLERSERSRPHDH